MSGKTLQQVRAEIDAIDAQLIALVDKRFKLALETRPLKGGKVYDPAREQQISDAIQALDAPTVSAEFRAALLRLILDESRRLQTGGETS